MILGIVWGLINLVPTNPKNEKTSLKINSLIDGCNYCFLGDWV